MQIDAVGTHAERCGEQRFFNRHAEQRDAADVARREAAETDSAYSAVGAPASKRAGQF